MLSQLTGLPALFVRKEAKTYGTCRLAEGGEVDGRRLTVVEDVVTSGGQVILSTEDLRERGATVEHAVIVIDRRGPDHQRQLADAGIDVHALFTMDELKRAGERCLTRARVDERVCRDAGATMLERRGAVQLRQGGVRGGSKLAGSWWPSIAANASSPHRWTPATGHGRLSRAKKPTARVSSGWPRSSPPSMRQWNSSE